MHLNKTVVAMIHVAALPGTPKNRLSMKDIIALAVKEAKLYRQAGVDVLAVENMHDIPYLNREVGPEITAAMTVVAREVKQAFGGPCGLQILAGANQQAMAAALAAELDFIRAEGFVFGHLADEGPIYADAGELLRYRRQIGADDIKIFCDIKKKHSSHAITADVSIEETAHAAEFFLSDGLIVTGAATGQVADCEEIARVRKAVKLPVLVGSGVTLDNVTAYAACSDAMIIGSYFKKDGYWANDVDLERVIPFVEKVKQLRG